MGIRGLRAYLGEKVRLQKRVLPGGSALVIDGDGWLFHLIQRSNGELHMDSGGSYGVFASVIYAEIYKLKSYGLKLIVLFDGSKNPLKDQTINDRLQQREQEWKSLHKFCFDPSTGHNHNIFPLAPLGKEQLVAILDQCSISHLQCQHEADQEIALLVQQRNLSSVSGPLWFAYAQDSDYLVMKDCPYIEFGEIEVNASGNICAAVWSRADVCRALHLSEEEFLDFVLFLGNDYTAPLMSHTDLSSSMRQTCNNNFRLVVDSWLRTITNQRKVLLCSADFFRPLPSHCDPATQANRRRQIEKLQFVMDYSRALYNLESLDSFHEQARLSTPPVLPYSSASCVFDFHHYSDASEGKFFADLGGYVKVAGKMGTEGVDRGVAVHALTYLKRRCSSGATLVPIVTDEHRTAIRAMLVQLQEPTLPTETSSLSGSFHPRLQWADLLAAFVYQKTCALMLKTFPRGAFVGEHNAPLKLFDGAAFHAALRKLRASVPVPQEVSPVPVPVAPELPPSAEEKAVASQKDIPCDPEFATNETADTPGVVADLAANEEEASDSVSPPPPLDAPHLPPAAESVSVKLSPIKLDETVQPSPGANVKVSRYQAPRGSLSKRSFLGDWRGDGSIKANNKVNNEPESLVSPKTSVAIRVSSVPTKAETSEISVTKTESVVGASIRHRPSPPACVSSETVVPRYQPPQIRAQVEARKKWEQNAERRNEHSIGQRNSHLSYPLLQAAPLPVPSDATEPLPIDLHRDRILHHIQQNRVTIIHGETGCGKSSRLPQFLLEDAEASQRHCKIFVAQPRRIGVVGMLKRLRPVLGNKVGMRMGHGVRDETNETQLHYCTTGYLVKLVAHSPQALKRCTHVVIDEVHERSVDGDLICLLVRDLLCKYLHLRVVLMSATINTDLYQEYFSQYDDGSFGKMHCLSVGVKRFPVEMISLDDLACDKSYEKADEVRRHARNLLQEAPLTRVWTSIQYHLVKALLLSVCKTGSTALVFISGLDDIAGIAALLEPYSHLLVCPLHSTTPEEEQDLIFEPTPPGCIKVVLATNMAESSVTIPDCDVVICLGTHKAVAFSDTLQRTHVAFGLLSKASATQRAGRTGRVRPGTVYRLYSKDTYESMKEHELAEVLRRPLEDVVLNMWIVLENSESFEGVTPFLHRLIEAPDMNYIDKSYEKLFEATLITYPGDEGSLTPAGRFVAALPLDQSLARMLSYGVLLGVSAEAVVIAAVLSLSRQPYRIANSIFLDPDQYNTQIRNRFLSEVHYDQGCYSEPIAMIRLFLEWRELESNEARYRFCHSCNLQFSVMKQFSSTVVSLVQHLQHAQQQSAHIPAERVDIGAIGELSASTINVLRLMMLWSFSENIMQLERSKYELETLRVENGTLEIEPDCMTAQHLQTLFGPILHELNEPENDYCYSFRYTIDCTEPDVFLRVLPLMNRLVTIARDSDAPCFAFIIETLDPEATLVVVVFLPHEYKGELIEEFHSTVLAKERLGDDRSTQSLFNGFPDIPRWNELFVCSDASQQEVSMLNQMLEDIDLAIIVRVSVRGLVELKSVDEMLSQEQLAFLFGVVPKNKKERRVFKMEPPPYEPTTINFPRGDDRAQMPSIIEDLPEGHRFVQCCRANRMKSRLAIKLQASEVTEEDLLELENSPYEVKRAGQCFQRQVWVSAVAPRWDYYLDDSCYSAKLPRQSMISASFHLGPDPLFAIAHTALPITKLETTSFVVGGVTFLPTDPIWLQLAMRTMGKDHMWNKLLESLDHAVTHETPQELLDQARSIDNAVQDASEFVRRDDIIAQVNTLFASFIQER